MAHPPRLKDLRVIALAWLWIQNFLKLKVILV
jgi:hypothetical protein